VAYGFQHFKWQLGVDGQQRLHHQALVCLRPVQPLRAAELLPHRRWQQHRPGAGQRLQGFRVVDFAIVAINSYSGVVTQAFSLANITGVTNVTPWITSATLSLAPQTPVTVTGSSFTYALPAMSIVTFAARVPPPPPADPDSVTSCQSDHQRRGYARHHQRRDGSECAALT